MNTRRLRYRLQCIRAQAPSLLKRLSCAISGHQWLSRWFPHDIDRLAQTEIRCARCDERMLIWAWPAAGYVQLPRADGHREMIKAPWRPQE